METSTRMSLKFFIQRNALVHVVFGSSETSVCQPRLPTRGIVSTSLFRGKCSLSQEISMYVLVQEILLLRIHNYSSLSRASLLFIFMTLCNLQKEVIWKKRNSISVQLQLNAVNLICFQIIARYHSTHLLFRHYATSQ